MYVCVVHVLYRKQDCWCENRVIIRKYRTYYVDMLLLWTKKHLPIYVRTWMYSFIFLQGIFFTDIGRNASRCLHTHLHTVGYNRLIGFVTFFFFKLKKLNFMIVHMVPYLWWDSILNSKYIHIIQLLDLFNASHAYNLYVTIFLKVYLMLINSIEK